MINQENVVYPNSVIDRTLTVNLDEPNKHRMSLLTADGKEVPFMVVSKSAGKIELKFPASISSGTYYLQVEERRVIIIHKLVIQ